MNIRCLSQDIFKYIEDEIRRLNAMFKLTRHECRVLLLIQAVPFRREKFYRALNLEF